MSATQTDDPAVGQTIEEKAAEEPAQLPLPGTREELSLGAGGVPPESASMKFRGGSVGVDGEYEKGAIVHAWVEIQVSEVHFVDKVDANGNVTGTERRHIGRVRRIQKA